MENKKQQNKMVDISLHILSRPGLIPGNVKMSHCDSFYRSLDRKLEQKMTIDEIAMDLCSKTKDPRRNMILDIKEHKGEDWLIENADWLGYQIQKHEKVKVASYCNPLSIAPISTVSAISVKPEATISDTTLKEISYISKLETPIIPVTSPVTSAGWEQKEKSEVPKIIEEVCIIGKIIPDCNFCKYGEYLEHGDKWKCDTMNFNCANKACFFDDEIVCECGFKSRRKDVYYGHVSEIHTDRNDLIRLVKGKLFWEDIRRQLVICPCGCGYGYRYNNNDCKWYTKEELDTLREIVNKWDSLHVNQVVNHESR